ncbi:hypothetical protein V5H41_29180, partial [Salmonella enterica]
PVSHIHHDDNGVTIETSEGCYHASKALISAGTWVKALFNSPVSHIHHDDNGVTIETSEGCYHASKALISAGTW